MSNISDSDTTDQGMVDVPRRDEQNRKQTSSESEPAPAASDNQDPHTPNKDAEQPSDKAAPAEGSTPEQAPEQHSEPTFEPVSEPFSDPAPKAETAQFEGNEPFPSPETAQEVVQETTPAETESAPTSSPTATPAVPDAGTMPEAAHENVPTESASEAEQATVPEIAISSSGPTLPPEPINPSPRQEPAAPLPVEPVASPAPSHAASESASASIPTSSPSSVSPSPAAPHPHAQAASSTPDPIPSGIVGLILAKARAIKQIRRQKKLLKIMTLFARKDTITNDDVERLLRVSDATATRYLSELETIGKVVQVGKTGRGVEYRAK
ncbi:MAG TPA: hypothetical protein VLB83_02370 [Candidatus Paceibacterota bacterium]|nr:hypothetical protein [Candidatus Paceibacterota bacterium]